MSNVDLSDFKKLEEQLNTLDTEVKGEIIYKSLYESAKVLFNATKQSLVAKMGPAATSPIRRPKNTGFYPPLIEGVRIRGDKPYCEVKVHILGPGYLRFFEKGTQIRKTSKGYNRGSISGLNFFLNARQSSLSNMEKALYEKADKLIKKYMK